MNIENLRWWHWLLISLLVGGILAATRDFYGPTFDENNSKVSTGALKDEFASDVVNSPIDPTDKYLDKYNHRVNLENLVVHGPFGRKPAYVVDVQTDAATFEVEVRDGQVTARRDKAGKGHSYVLPVMWKNVPLDKLPPQVSAAATTSVPGRVIAAHYGPTDIHYYVSGYEIRHTFLPASGTDPRLVLNYQPVYFIHDAPVPYRPPRADNMVLHRAGVEKWNPAADHTTTDLYPVSPKFDVNNVPREFPTVLDYLNALNAKYPTLHLSYRYAWWEQRLWIYVLWIGVSVIIIGLIWPALLYMLLNAGFGRVPEPEYDLSRFKGEAKDKDKKRKAAADMSGVKALNDQLEAGLLADAKPGSTPAPAAAATATVNENPFASAKAAPLESAPVNDKPKQKDKSFGIEGGSYYPTEIHAGKRPGEPEPAKKD